MSGHPGAGSRCPSGRAAQPTVWIVGAGEAQKLRAVLGRLGEVGSAAVVDGRVFVDGRRAVRDTQWVAPGQRVELFPPRAGAGALQVLDERGGILAVAKPAGMPTEPDRRGSGTSVTHLLAAELRTSPATLHALSRLDLGVSGIVLFARSPEARRLGLAARHSGKLACRYLAQVVRSPEPPCGSWEAPLAGRRRRAGRPGTKVHAQTRFALVASADCSAAACLVRAEAASPALLAVEPVTGRKHQIRVHARLAGCPLLGDRAYGGPTRLLGRDGSVRRLERIALHAARVELHAARGIWRVQAPLPEELVDLWRQLGGRVEDFELGLQGVRL